MTVMSSAATDQAEDRGVATVRGLDPRTLRPLAEETGVTAAAVATLLSAAVWHTTDVNWLDRLATRSIGRSGFVDRLLTDHVGVPAAVIDRVGSGLAALGSGPAVLVASGILALLASRWR